MDIFIGSDNGHKIAAMREAASQVFPNTSLNVIGKKTDTGMPEQLERHEQIIAGALSRLEVLKVLVGNTRYDLLVAMQDGIHATTIGGNLHWFNTSWVVVEDAQGNQAFAHSTGVEFSVEDVNAARTKGFDTTTVGAVIAECTGGDPTDPLRGITSDTLTRSGIIGEAVKAAIGQLLKKSESLRALVKPSDS